MPRELTNPPELHPTPGFSHIAEAKGTRLIMFAGQVALDTEFNIIGGGDLYEQTKAAMSNLEVAVRTAGVAWSDIVRRTIYTTQPHEFETITRAVHEVTNETEDPPQTIVGVTGLALPGLLIEIECTASV